MAGPSSRKSDVVRTLNSLLRSELSATESYTQAIPRVGGSRATDIEVLRKIAREHGQAVETIRAEIQRAGGVPTEASGVWPAFTKTVDGPAKVFVDAIALTELKNNEEQTLQLYNEALNRVNGESAAFIKDSLIPAQKAHVDALDDMIARL